MTTSRTYHLSDLLARKSHFSVSFSNERPSTIVVKTVGATVLSYFLYKIVKDPAGALFMQEQMRYC